MSSTRRLSGLLLFVLVGLAVPACGTVTTSGQPTPTTTPTTSFHALIVAGAAVDALDPTTGTLLWNRTLDNNVSQQPSVNGNIIAVSTTIPSTQPPAGRVVALAAATGATVWQRDLGADTQGAIAAVGSDFVLATSAVSVDAPNAPAGVTVSALRPADGSSIWHHTLSDTDVLSPMLFSGSTIFVVTGQTTSNDMTYTLSAFDVASGSQLWQKAMGTGTLLGSIAGDGAVYVSMFPGHIPIEGSLQPPQTATTSAANHVLASRDSPTAMLTAFRASDGAQLWQVNGFTTAQAEVAGTLFATTPIQDASGVSTFTVTAYRAASGTVLWQSGVLGTGDIFQDKPVISADTHRAFVFNMPEAQPSVHALDGATGHVVWTVPLSAHVAAHVAAIDRVFVGVIGMPPSVETMRTSVMALDSATGAMGWTHDVAPSAGVGLVLQ